MSTFRATRAVIPGLALLLGGLAACVEEFPTEPRPGGSNCLPAVATCSPDHDRVLYESQPGAVLNPIDVAPEPGVTGSGNSPGNRAAWLPAAHANSPGRPVPDSATRSVQLPEDR